LAKLRKSGIIRDVSTYPLPTFRPRQVNYKSKALTFDINFELVGDDGDRFRVWFYRGLRFPPPLNEGDRVEVYGKFGQFFGCFSKNVFYASKIIDRKRGKIYTGFRNKKMKGLEKTSFPEGLPRTGDAAH
jgi:hypothetical protein